MQLVDPPHHRQIVRAHRNRPVIQGGARDLQQTALRHDRQDRVIMVHQREPFGRLMAQTFCEKNPAPPSVGRSSHTTGPSGPRPPRRRHSPRPCSARTSDAVPSSRVFFQAWIWLACTPNRLDKFGDRAFLPDRRQRDLRLELRTVLLPSIGHVSPLGRPAAPKGRLSLSYLSSFRGPPQRRSCPYGPTNPIAATLVGWPRWFVSAGSKRCSSRA